jgi:hypothetical protein
MRAARIPSRAIRIVRGFFLGVDKAVGSPLQPV